MSSFCISSNACNTQQLQQSTPPLLESLPSPLRWRVVGYVPKCSALMVSLVKSPQGAVRKFVNDPDLVVIPANAIIDRIEFFGQNMVTKGTFSIGLGQLNGSILSPLIEHAEASTANEKIGGCRDFISQDVQGKTNKVTVVFNSFVNIILEHPMTGLLQVIVEYHLRP